MQDVQDQLTRFTLETECLLIAGSVMVGIQTILFWCTWNGYIELKVQLGFKKILYTISILIFWAYI